MRTFQLDNMNNLRDLQELMCHTNIATTSIYLHTQDHKRKAAMFAMDDNMPLRKQG
ncbi:hypothetical protein [Tumebacillus sp. BK434]|uniref:hypothetical protein n=1 Tax=Tumebacillus sp. BK434 TaxID=2512169 RepID=UPI0014051650|nr:hypothetical protein [Tumebacillus sp. BK434]